ncbi:MAG: hypothetical protein JNL18_16305 [Planctomycetaceae bacterium]|nr:hypothetical protein [Planctomycetaceae bacterium]
MTTLLTEPPPAAPADRLRREMAALRLSFHWLGARKTLSRQQRTEAAQQFGAAGEFLSAGKKLLDTSHPRFKEVSAVRHRALDYARGMSLPFPEPGIRLIRRADLDEIERRLGEFQLDLGLKVSRLEAEYAQLREAAREQLGRLYAPSDYPASLTAEFALSWDFPSVEPPEYLRRLSPELYRREAARVAARFDAAVELAEEAFAAEMSQLVGRLAERLAGEADGRPKIFRDSAVANLSDFFQRFRRLNVRSSAELEELVDQAAATLAGVAPQALRDGAALRRQVAGELTRVQAALEGLMVDRPRRNLLRSAPEA